MKSKTIIAALCALVLAGCDKEDQPNILEESRHYGSIYLFNEVLESDYAVFFIDTEQHRVKPDEHTIADIHVAGEYVGNIFYPGTREYTVRAYAMIDGRRLDARNSMHGDIEGGCHGCGAVKLYMTFDGDLVLANYDE